MTSDRMKFQLPNGAEQPVGFIPQAKARTYFISYFLLPPAPKDGDANKIIPAIPGQMVFETESDMDNLKGFKHIHQQLVTIKKAPLVVMNWKELTTTQILLPGG